jgi:hypothetical protein
MADGRKSTVQIIDARHQSACRCTPASTRGLGLSDSSIPLSVDDDEGRVTFVEELMKRRRKNQISE